MPTLAENIRRWARHDWNHEGHRWSPGSTRAGTDLMWWRSIRPRLHRHLPTDTILEIGPGCGRWTAYLINECRRLIGVDITEHCVELCRDRFSATNAEFHVNDGQSLATVPDASLDLAFSFDSLVHAEAEPVQHYLFELARTLKPGGAAFLHHSNLGAYANQDGAIPSYVRDRYWRAGSVCARTFREAAAQAGLHCVAQEMVNWVGHDSDIERHLLPGAYFPLTDCFSVVQHPSREDDRVTRVYINRQFIHEWQQLVDLSRVYSCETRLGVVGSLRQEPRTRRVPRVLRGWRVRSAGWLFSVREPLASSVARKHCPECAGELLPADDMHECRSCRVAYLLR